MFFSELSVLEHITKPQRPNVFSEEFGLCFWPKTFQHHLLLIYSAVKNKKRGEEKRGKKNRRECVRERGKNVGFVGGAGGDQAEFPFW